MKLDENRVRQIRERQGLTLAMVATRAGTSKNTVLSAEHGGDLRPTTARKIAQALGVEIIDLLGEPEGPLGEAPPSQQPSFDNHLREERHRELRHYLYFALDSAAESGEEVEAVWKTGQGWGHLLRWMKEDAVARYLLEEWGETVGDDPEVREAQERLAAVERRINTLANQHLHGPYPPELEVFQRRYAAGRQLPPEAQEMGSNEVSGA